MPRPKRHNSSGYRSGLEVKFQAATLAKGWALGYEQDKIKYVIPASNHTYTPDFTVTKNVYIETKGLWTGADRKKAVLIKQQHPEVEILYVFQRNQGLSKKSTTTYLDWAAKNGLDACVFSDTACWTEYILRHI
ncbi:endonuclease I [uncultured Caudovirales phage]|uniref:Endonuclease I n=1 Tax=uncultured Caudovirales phage TaxID=2100421 RepID=A0A6J5T821_9CAUD|nr:endonuclease I [uncultured Caudovirales phage]